MEMIVKYRGKQLAERSLACEYFGNVVAREMGVQAPTPHILMLDSETVRAMNADYRVKASGAIVPEGIAVGSEWFSPAVTPGIGGRLIGVQAEEAARIYAYDLMLQQPDRTTKNPNILEIRSHFVAIDFETSCSFLFAILADPAPWRVSAFPYSRSHFFRARLTPSTVDWRALVMPMIHIDLKVLDQVVDEALPSAWHDDCHRVLEHIEKLKQREMDLIWEIITSVTGALT